MYPYFDAVEEDQSDSRKIQYIDLNFWLPGDILAKADKMTMAHSLELRVPFLDIEVAKKYPLEYLRYLSIKRDYQVHSQEKLSNQFFPKTTANRKN